MGYRLDLPLVSTAKQRQGQGSIGAEVKVHVKHMIKLTVKNCWRICSKGSLMCVCVCGGGGGGGGGNIRPI